MEVRMSKRKKILIACSLIALLLIIVVASVKSSSKNTVLVQTSKVQRKDVLVSKVNASGSIRAKQSTNLQSEIAGIITDISVREGDSVKKGDVLLKIDPIQTEADRNARRANYDISLADARNQEFVITNAENDLSRNEASLKSVRADLDRAENNLARVQSSFNRKQQLHEDGLLAREDYEIAQNELKAAKSQLEASKAAVAQTESSLRVARNNIEQRKIDLASSHLRAKAAEANLTSANDQLKKTTLFAPLSGVVTQLLVEKGERAQPGIMSNPQATLMTIADLSVIQAELKVDETDIVNLKLGDVAKVKIDALPNDAFEGAVTEIGNSPIQSSSSSQQEAKDFKVIVTLSNPSNKIRPGMSCTGDIITETRKNVLIMPIQALTVRDMEVDKDGNYHPPDLNKKSDSGALAAARKENIRKKELEGVFVIDKNNMARFRTVKTGITGESEIEVLENLKEGEEIVSGSFQTLRTIKDGAIVKIDNKSQTEKKS
jgi:HlyD family secretion protein